MKRLPAVLAAAALLLALAVPVGATTLVATLGDKTTYFNHFGDPPRVRSARTRRARCST